MDEADDVIEQGSPKPLPLPSRNTLIALAAVIALVAVGVGVAVARPWYHRTALPDPCRLLPAATMARYVPGAVNQGPVLFTSAARKTGMCAWSGMYAADNTFGPLLELEIDEYATPDNARRDFGAVLTAQMVNVDQPGGSTRAVNDVADQARAFLAHPAGGDPLVILEVRSGATLVELTYAIPPPPAARQPDDTVVLADSVAMARAALSDFGTAPVPVASPVILGPASSGGLRYGVPANPCRLLTDGTVTRYLGIGVKGSSVPDFQVAPETAGTCQWASHIVYSLSVSVITFSRAASSHVTQQAQQAMEGCLADFAVFELRAGTLSAPRRVPDVGSESVAVFATGIPASVAVFAWSGNAEVSVLLEAPDKTPAAELSVAARAARAALAALPRAS